ncbi:MAG TPA: type IV pilus assembly protein PilM [Candidatus Limnocylindria bacterium]|nr:type IV pilus assembly protein PilM [Candidatus Limnocylindria bacterium]
MFFSKNNSILGVDIGTANIKIAQITHGSQPVLDTYGIVNTPYQLGGKNDEVAVKQMADILKSLVEKAGVTAKKCVISFPNSSVFTSVLELPKMNEKELASAVEFEAKKYVPLALSEIDLSWTVIDAGNTTNNTFKILLTAVPKLVTENYMKVFSLAGLEPQVAEIEALALIRSLIGSAPINCVIIDIGARSTGLNILENGLLRLCRNLNIGGDTITDKVAQSLNISVFRAEQFKKDFGVSNSTFIPDTIKPVLNIIKNEVKQILAIYQSQDIVAEKIFLVGGGANLPGIVAFFQDLNITVELGNPLKAVSYGQDLEPVLKRYALSLPVAIGLALRK